MDNKPAKFSVVGVILAVLAAVFVQRGDDTTTDPNTDTKTGGIPTIGAPADPTPQATQRPTDEAASNTESQTRSNAESTKSVATKNAPTEQKPAATGPPPSTSRVGFTSRASWQSHFEKHGAEFGKITAEEYLERAKALRDAPLSKDVLELIRDDGVITRFDKRSGDFVAFHEDKTIRTLFRPNDGEAYFRRQAER